jgi:CRISPR/Cas system-associated endonuclease Cas1
MLSSPTLTATVESRREQLKAFDDARGLEFARAVVRGKIRNQRHLLLYCGKYLKQSDPERHAAVAELAKQLRQLEVKARKVGIREQVAGNKKQGTGGSEQDAAASGAGPGPNAVRPYVNPKPLTVSEKRQELLGLEGVAGRDLLAGLQNHRRGQRGVHGPRAPWSG